MTPALIALAAFNVALKVVVFAQARRIRRLNSKLAAQADTNADNDELRAENTVIRWENGEHLDTIAELRDQLNRMLDGQLEVDQ